MHDSWIGLCVSNNGGLIIDLDNSSILYRQHNNNVLGARPMASIITKLFNIVTVFKKNYYYYKMVRKATGISFLTYIKLKIQICFV